MRKILVLAALCMTAMMSAQTPSEKYEQRYNMLSSQFGAAGVGVETVLDNWEKVDSTNARLLLARFDFYLTKAQSISVVKKENRRYLGMEPVLVLKDSLQRDIYYYQETFYDDDLYGKAIKTIDKAVNLYPDRIDFRFVKANALIAYEKESPDMAMDYLKSLVAEASRRSADWIYGDEKVGKDFVEDAMQEYCYSFYSIASPKAFDAFLRLSEKMHALHPDNPGFLNNIGSYHMVVDQDYKAALKCYGKVLKKHPEDYTAIKNSMLAARKMKNLKLEKKYLQMIAAHGPENEREQAQMRLEAMKK